MFVEEVLEELDGVTDDDCELTEPSYGSAIEGVPAVSDTKVTVVVGGILFYAAVDVCATLFEPAWLTTQGGM